MKTRLLSLTLLALLSLFATNATQAQLPPSTQPLVLSHPGVYVLNRDIRVANGDGIILRASGITLDLNGHSVTTATPSTAPFQTRGIFVDGTAARLKAVTVKNGKIGSFSVNFAATNVDSLCVSDLQIVGEGAATNGGPTEVGIMLISSRGGKIKGNLISSVNLGLFVRGSGSTGNRLTENTIVGGDTPAYNLLGICYNPAPGNPGATDGPRGDLIYNNNVSRFGYGIAISGGSRVNIFRDNSLAAFNGGFREPGALVVNGGTNVSDANIEVILP